MPNEPCYLPPLRRTVGSSYFLQQTPTAERMGGLEVRLAVPSSSNGLGIIRIEHVLWRTGEPYDNLQPWISEALRGIQDYATRKGIELERFDITLSQFLVHPTDSHSHQYYLASQNALASALNAWNQVSPD